MTQGIACIQEDVCGPEYCSESGENQPIAKNKRRKSTSGREEKLERNFDVASGIIFRIKKFFQKSKQKLSIYFFSL